MGLLRVKGSIDINQFWPTGKSSNILSDADTVHVQVDPKSSFVFEGNVTRAFDFAWITTRKDKDGSRSPNYVMVSQRTANAHTKIRLQGIDAPELHYRVDQKKQEVRQNWGKRAAFELRNFLKSRASGMKMGCHVETLVKSPKAFSTCTAFATWVPGGSSIAAKIPSASTAAQTSKNFRYRCQAIAMISVGFTKLAHTTSCSICRATKVKERAGERSCLAAVQRRFLSRKE